MAAAFSALWARHCQDAGLPADLETGAALIEAYGAPARRYHGLSHLAFLFSEEERLAAQIQDRALVRFAIWFHDAIYLPAAPDNEDQSAAWAQDALKAAPDLAVRVAALILKTKAHGVGAASPDEALFLDMDIAILGAPADTYRAYAAGVRQEYGAVPDGPWLAGRLKFIAAQRALPALFRTLPYRASHGPQAQINLAWEAGELAAGRIPA
jgi:predicted metal-dependent HD superfamily phosphohydrolase